MRRVLLIDRSGGAAEALRVTFIREGFEVRVEDQQWRASQLLRRALPECEFVVIMARNTCEDDVALLRELVAASQQFHRSGVPEFIFASCAHCASPLRIRIARLGARYVRL